MTQQITREPFGKTGDGAPVDIYTLRSPTGMEARICNYGGIVVSLTAPDRVGEFADVVLGYDTLEGYLTKSPYFGALIGRYGNRIAKAKFQLDGKTCTLAANNGPNSLHGGARGFDKMVWNAKPVETPQGPSLELSRVSKEGEEGYPGNLTVKAVYTLIGGNGLQVDFTATTDRDTVVNLTHHSYFNLACSGEILGHKLFIDADRFTPVDATLIPTGELRPVAGTPFDFRQPTTIGARIDQADEQLKFGKGYDHNWVTNPAMLGGVQLQAIVTEPSTGRILEILSTQPGLQFYSGNFLDGTLRGKQGRVYGFRSGFCLEPQHFPDSPNQPGFPPVVLQPGQIYRNTISYRFSAEK